MSQSIEGGLGQPAGAPAVSLCWGTVMGAPLLELASVAGAAGFDGITVTPAMVAQAEAAGSSLAELRRQVADAGVRVTMIDPLMSVLPGSPDPATAGGRFGDLFASGEDDCYRMAEGLEVPTINVAHYQAATDVPVDALADSFGALCQRAAGHGIDLLLEFLPEGSVPDLGTALAIVRACGEPNAAVMFDTWHFFRTGGTLADLDEVASSEIGGLQVSDAPAEQWGVIETGINTRLLPGEGTIPVGALVDRVLSITPRAFIGVEVFSADLNELPRAEAATRARVAMRSAMG